MQSATLPATQAVPRFVGKTRFELFGLTLDRIIQVFFGGNALVAVVVLTLITIFLFREGAGFFTQNHDNLRIYRQAGLEYVDILAEVETSHTALNRYLSDVRFRAYQHLTGPAGLAPAAANAQLAGFDEFAGKFADAIDPVRGMVSDLRDSATAIKTRYLVNQDRRESQRQLREAGREAEAAAITFDPIDFGAEMATLKGTLPAFRDAVDEMRSTLETALRAPPTLPDAALARRLDRFNELVRQFLGGLPAIETRAAAWDPSAPVSLGRSVGGFLFGREWLTASFWQDWYGIVPLFVGSLMVSLVALLFAIPMGVGAAIYVNQIASRAEQRFIKPAIEFIAAIPSVVLGFFGIAVLGQALRTLSQQSWLSWLPGFPYSERLNILTAGCLLALIAIPTIFTLAEDALNNVPRAFREASFALGATRLQTIVRIIMPASLSGIISAILLGFGRVIGETMVVLLCAGNRIAIPDFSAGLAVIAQPVHTMTGIIAQEMGEVVQGSIHYRALFCVGIALFFLSLLINYFAQKIVRRYRVSIG
ncbi:MAG TPA: phosphate ABC transporter permease subunit PstC [Lacunisphaera sp.]|nr:phosphate ABC transporter permease subunit PstC [Lacunisphaera sp.]